MSSCWVLREKTGAEQEFVKHLCSSGPGQLRNKTKCTAHSVHSHCPGNVTDSGLQHFKAATQKSSPQSKFAHLISCVLSILILNLILMNKQQQQQMPYCLVADSNTFTSGPILVLRTPILRWTFSGNTENLYCSLQNKTCAKQRQMSKELGCYQITPA